jgi:hypothetical protein
MYGLGFYHERSRLLRHHQNHQIMHKKSSNSLAHKDRSNAAFLISTFRLKDKYQSQLRAYEYIHILGNQSFSGFQSDKLYSVSWSC